MTRLWPSGQPVDVEVDAQGRPAGFFWRGRRHPVGEIVRDWRVDFGWWRQQQWRAYYKLRTESGLLVVLYQDLVSGRWYVQRLYD